ncbi:hypothetical protein JI667_06690 [Bacillus sp. NTK074B]|uniref:hypothetical protein n=1 Tax=Bacillus sp. NTK074B TaxID=2802174 RepID=UPI001A8EC263|nr:hypothetical protein [Bacillus sp. NTK074B]
MTKEKFRIQMPEDERVEREIHTIIRLGMKKKQSFPQFMWKMQKELGFRYLFVSQKDGIIMTMSIMLILTLFVSMMTEGAGPGESIYGAIFMISPLLFMALSLYDLFVKKQSEVFEVEMTAKFNLYQVSAFRMLHFSILSILMNTLIIACLIWSGHSVEILRALLISTASLFLFSSFYLVVFMKGNSGISVLKVVAGWLIVNIVPNGINPEVYWQFLNSLPAFVYGIVLAGSIACYLYYLSKLVRMRPVEGVL